MSAFLVYKINLILLGMLVLFLILALFGFGGYIEPIGVGLVLLCVGVIGTITKLKAQKYSLDLRNKTAVRHIMVVRNGKFKTINTEDIVVFVSYLFYFQRFLVLFCTYRQFP